MCCDLDMGEVIERSHWIIDPPQSDGSSSGGEPCKHAVLIPVQMSMSDFDTASVRSAGVL